MTPAFRPTLKPLAIALALASAGPALAFQFKFDNGITGSLDTTLSYGVSVRAGSRDPTLIGIANGGTSRSVNEDDGNLNYDKNKPFANVVKATSDLEIKYGNFGFFGRGTGVLRLRERGQRQARPHRPRTASARTSRASTASCSAPSSRSARTCACAPAAR